MASLNFDASQVDPSQAFDPVPAGWYNVQITESEIKPTTAGTGAYLAITMEVLDGPFAKRKLFDRFNIQNPNPVAVDIAYKQLSGLCHAAGVIQVQDSQQLHGRPIQAKVAVSPARVDPSSQKAYDASNEVKGYKAVGGAQPVGAPGAPAAGAPAWAAAAAAAPVAAAPTGWAPPVAAAPAAPAAPVVAAFPPAGWTAHPTSPGYFYQGQEVLTEADLRARMAPPAAPAAPVVPVAPVAPALPAGTPPWGAAPAVAAPVAQVAAVVAPAAAAAANVPPWARPAA